MAITGMRMHKSSCDIDIELISLNCKAFTKAFLHSNCESIFLEFLFGLLEQPYHPNYESGDKLYSDDAADLGILSKNRSAF